MYKEAAKFSSNTRLYVVYPHPDDEVFGCGGLIQGVLSAGGTVRVDILSSGEASTLRYHLDSDSDLSEHRVGEFRSVCSELGVVNFSISRFKDGGIRDQELEVTEYVKNRILEFKPTHVVTYEPCGVYGHPDHIALSNFVTNLYKELSNFVLIYSTVPEGFNLLEENLSMAEDPLSVRPLKPNFTYTLSVKELVTKIRCFKHYKSQMKPPSGFGKKVKTLAFIRKESFHVII